ncbi:argininosuccinate synthase [Thermoflavifilum thermophilum]|uniref:argininosuccinate synthase n=1 Tax=Thermoflavifilum thermophilum TaxID=1393122 RepID=A0A1I7NK79_9BACT|nr:argininosuccinate synthase [Thermoflavifilum thermophilum]SFV35047.1 argininosuccinate synthase [Thermoflavifilum thermophilum]
MKKKVVLGFSGGLDTSFCVKYLSEEKGYEVYTVTIDTGGFSPEELRSIEQRAYQLGAVQHITIDAVKPYYERVLKYLIFGNVLKNNTYPLSVSAERMTQALILVEKAQEIQADAIAHGSTGAGNDQVRFDMVFHVLAPEKEIITPIRDLRLSREAEVQYLKEHGVDVSAEKSAYSINKGIWGTSVGGKETLTSDQFLPESAFPHQVSRHEPEDVVLQFEKGEPVGLNDESYAHPVEVIRALNDKASAFGIGRDIHVGDTIIGIKGRVGFEAAGPLIILKAHHALEKHVLTKWQLMMKDQLAIFYGNWVHEGLLLDPVMRDIESFFISSQQRVTGKVLITLFPYRFQVNGIQSPYDLMQSKFGTYGEMNNAWTGEDVRGFSKIMANGLRIWYQTHPKQEAK